MMEVFFVIIMFPIVFGLAALIPDSWIMFPDE